MYRNIANTIYHKINENTDTLTFKGKNAIDIQSNCVIREPPFA